VWAGGTLGVVGGSGSGKTTLARTLLGLVEPSEGRVIFGGRELSGGLGRRGSQSVRDLQIVFQNPGSALNARHAVRRILRRSIRKLGGISGVAAEQRMVELMESVRLSPRYAGMRPGQLSVGLKQRVAIARAFAGDPKLVVCDEPTSALDVSTQATILNLLVELQARCGVAYIFISHDLAVARYVSDRIAVLYLGRVLEIGPAEVVFGGPHHPYTEALLSSVATTAEHGRERIKLTGEMPSPAAPPAGCVFHTRCPHKLGAIGELEEPPLNEVEDGHLLRCHLEVAELPGA